MDIPGIPNVGDSIAAIAALGTAAYGLVDAMKVFWGGPSVAGFGRIKAALAPFNPALDTLGNAPWQTLRANWLNGVAKADQKAAAKSLIHLALSPGNAKKLAAAVGINADTLETVAKKINKGTELTKSDMDVLGRFDALVSAILDAAYERADQQYRNTAKLLSSLVAMALAAFAGYFIQAAALAAAKPPKGLDVGAYVMSKEFLIAIIIGAVSTPLAPIAKDLSTSLAAAVKAVGAFKR
jgi:hypothetical protein